MKCWKCGASEPEAVFGRHGDASRRGYCNACHLSQRRAAHARAREHRNALRREAYARNANGAQDKARAARKARYAREGNAALKKWIRDNPERYREYQRRKMRRYSANLTDAYVRNLLVQHGSALKRADIPAALVEVKRMQIMIERAVNEASE